MTNRDYLAVLGKFAGELPRPLNILVQRRSSDTRNFAYAAMCLQYSIQGKAATAQDAVLRVLRNLSRYLRDCAQHKAEPFSAAHDQFQQIFYRAKPLDIGVLPLGDVHLRVRVVDHGQPRKAPSVKRRDPVIDLDIRETTEALVLV